MSGPRLDHVAIFVTDVDAAIEFYGVLGFEEENRLEIEDRVHAFLSLESSEARLQVSGPVPVTDAGAGHLALRVEDVDSTYEGLLEHGAQPLDPPHDIPEAAVRVAMVADPEGHQVELIVEIET